MTCRRRPTRRCRRPTTCCRRPTSLVSSKGLNLAELTSLKESSCLPHGISGGLKHIMLTTYIYLQNISQALNKIKPKFGT